jgi:hypothetical protein
MKLTTTTKKTKFSSIKTAQKYETNPFAKETEITQIVEVSEDRFIKSLIKDLAIWLDLSKCGQRVLGILLTRVQYETTQHNLIFFSAADEKNTFKISKATFYRGIEELIYKKIIARHINVNWYFVNPTILVNKNPGRFVREYKIIQSVTLPSESAGLVM